MAKKVRFNANLVNSEKLRTVQRAYQKIYGMYVSLEGLANSAIDFGLEGLRKKLNIPEK